MSESPFSSSPRLSRRRMLGFGATAAGAIAAGPLLSGCSGSSTSTGSPTGADAKADLVLTTWNIPADLVAYKKYAAAYTKTHPGVNVKIQTTPNGDFNQYLSTQLAGGNAPDIIRNTWQQIGRWAKNGGFVPLDQYLSPNYKAAGFGDTFWQAAQYNGKVFGIPQHPDTFGTYYRTDVMDKVGAKIPTSLDAAWTWDQFLSLAKEVKSATGKAAIAYGFEGVNTAYRWLPFLYMHGGKLMEDDGVTPAIDNQAGVETIAWFQNLYNEGLIPKSNTIKGSTTAAVENTFTTGQVGLMIFGDWIMGDIAKAADRGPDHPDLRLAMERLRLAAGRAADGEQVHRFSWSQLVERCLRPPLGPGHGGHLDIDGSRHHRVPDLPEAVRPGHRGVRSEVTPE